MTSHELAFHILRAGLALSLILGFFLIIRLFVRRHQGVALAEIGQHILTVCLTLACAILVYAFVNHDFSNAYVYAYSDRNLPLFYRITALWGGQDGSLLFWAWSIALSGSIFALTPAYRRLSAETRYWFWLFFFAIMGFFFLLLSSWSNPFMMLSPVPADGRGLNPLLQNPGMILHPPLLFLGYGGFTIPACLALAQHLTQNKAQDGLWISVTRPITLGAWVLLTAGILLGAWWAYMELGWGGYWAWDPVENASLIPWLVGTAFLHTAVLEVRRGKLARFNVFLICMTTLSAFFATYLVRSGIVQSVHAFGSTGISLPLLLFIVLFAILTIAVVTARQAQPGKALASLDSREGFLVLVAWVFIALSAVVLAATVWPVLRAIAAWLPLWIGRLPVNRYMLILVALVLAVALVELIAWKVARKDRWDGLPPDTGGLHALTIILCVILAAFAVLPFLGALSPNAQLFGPGGVLLEFGSAVKNVGGKIFEADFYNRVCLPLFILVGLILALCPWLRWKGGMRSSRAALSVLFILIAGGIAIWYFQHHLLFLSAGVPDENAMAALTQNDPLMAQTVRPAFKAAVVRGIIAAAGGAAAVACLASLVLQLFFDPAVRRDRRSRAAWGIHLGTALLLLGVAFSGPYKQEVEGSLPLPQALPVSMDTTAMPDAQQEFLQLGEYEVRLEALNDLVSVVQTQGADPVVVRRDSLPDEYFRPGSPAARSIHFESVQAVLRVTRNGEYVATLTPERRMYAKFGNQRFTEASTSFSLGDELYATVNGAQNGRVYLLVSAHPLVNWMWLGGVIMCLAPLLAISLLKRRNAAQAEATANA